MNLKSEDYLNLLVILSRCSYEGYKIIAKNEIALKQKILDDLFYRYIIDKDSSLVEKELKKIYKDKYEDIINEITRQVIN